MQNTHTIPAEAQQQIDAISDACLLHKPLVAIKCYTYNHVEYLADALEGFIKQKTNFPFVAIVHDDASTDGTTNIIREYAEKYPDIIKPIYERVNQYSKKDNSLIRIMEEAIATTGAKYIGMCEGDDYWNDPHKLQKQVDFLESHPDVIGCYADVDYIYVEKGIHLPWFVKHRGIPISFEDHLMNKYYIAPPTWLFRATSDVVLKPAKRTVDVTYTKAMDFLATSKFIYMDEIMGVYRGTPNGASHVKSASGVHNRQVGLWRSQREYVKRYSSLVCDANKAIIRNHILVLVNLAIFVGDEYIAELAYRYARRNMNIKVMFKIKFLSTRIGKFILKKHYSKQFIV